MGVTLDRFKKAFTKTVSPDLLAARQKKVTEALRELKVAVDTLETVGASPEPFKTKLLGLAVRTNNIVKSPALLEDKYKDLDGVKDEARAKAAEAKRAALAAPETQAGTGELLAKATCGNEKPARLRTLAEQALKTDPDALKKLVKVGGPKIIDDMVKDVGNKATTDDQKEFMKSAIVARYDMTKLEGDLTTKALPKLYQVLGMIPESHARGNPKMAKIKLKIGDGSGDYTGGQINLNCNRPNDAFDTTRFDSDDEVKPEWKVPSKEVCEFSQVTLHEVGHAVDDKLKFMKLNGHKPEFGGWQKLKVGQVADLAAAKFRFYEAFQEKYGASILKFMLAALLEGPLEKKAWVSEKAKANDAPSRQELLDDAGIKAAEVKRQELASADEWDTAAANDATNVCRPGFRQSNKRAIAFDIIRQVLLQNVPVATAVDDLLQRLSEVPDPPDDDEWNKIIEHDAVKWCVKTKVGEMWKGGAAKANEVVLDDRVYTKDKSGWYSYEIEARKKSVSKYQFNAPGEWFAELYSAYYMKKLPKRHPDYSWFEVKVHAHAE